MDIESATNFSKGLLMMRCYFLVTTFLNLYVTDTLTGEVVIGNTLKHIDRSSLAHKKSHLMVVDKKVAEIYLADSLMEPSE